jgi:glyceraldehyde-3-phosphate dehydrogenase (NADP+)
VAPVARGKPGAGSRRRTRPSRWRRGNSQCQRGPDTFPFNGHKDSAEGTLSVADALRVFSIRTLVAAKTTPENTTLVQSILTRRESEFLTTDFLF